MFGTVASVLVVAQTALAAGATSQASIVDRGERFVRMLVDGRYDQAVEDFAPEMRKAMSATQLGALWKDLVRKNGPLQGTGNGTVKRLGRWRAVFVPCRFARASLQLKVVYDQEGLVSGLWVEPAGGEHPYKPPAYVKQDRFFEQPVTLGSEPWTVHGTLTLPKDARSVPGVVLVHGSGPHDRDETIGPNKPFKDLGWGLATHGVAVLRYDKRTKVHGARMKVVNMDTVVIQDAVAALETIRTVEQVDPKRVYVLGHSLGGTLAPHIARRDGNVAGIILTAASVRPIEDVLVEQAEYLASLSEAGPHTTSSSLAGLRQLAAGLKSRRLKPEDKLMGAPASFWYDWADHDAEAALGAAVEFNGRVLVLQGGRDYQVTRQDFALWERGLPGYPRTTCRLFEDLNHLFMAGKGKATPAEYQKPGHLDVRVIEMIAKWIVGDESR